MLIKEKDDISSEIAWLEAAVNGAQDEQEKEKLSRSLAMLLSGSKGESSSAYHLDIYFSESRNWALIHDLRIEHKDYVAQIDHLLISRTLDVYVIETKNFNSGLQINAEGEFYTFYNKRPHGIPSPVEQNERHIHLLDRFLTDNNLLPRRFWFSISPRFFNVVLVSPSSYIKRPKKESFDSTMVMKADMFKKWLHDTQEIEPPSPLDLVKVISRDKLMGFANALVKHHSPSAYDYSRKYRLYIQRADNKKTSGGDKPKASVPGESTNRVGEEKGQYRTSKSKYFCAKCKSPISFKVASFCFNHKERFEGRAYCMGCQKEFGDYRH